jgi:hypothetical protein
MWIGVYEFQHCLDVPWRVVLNECIELAKAVRRHRWPQVCQRRAQRLGAAVARSRSASRPPAARKAAHADMSQRAQRIEPFYVMEVAKAAAGTAPPACGPHRPAHGLPEHRRARLHRTAPGAGGRRAGLARRTHRSTPQALGLALCANASATGTPSALACRCRPAASSSPLAPQRRCNWPAWP